MTQHPLNESLCLYIYIYNLCGHCCWLGFSSHHRNNWEFHVVYMWRRSDTLRKSVMLTYRASVLGCIPCVYPSPRAQSGRWCTDILIKYNDETLFNFIQVTDRKCKIVHVFYRWIRCLSVSSTQRQNMFNTTNPANECEKLGELRLSERRDEPRLPLYLHTVVISTACYLMNQHGALYLTCR